ncbi:MAG: hypothetical protein H7Y89_12945 [Steroidobacteraceae bacterium]|nr:hypothetical protein [Steroidobacteraceae bacterium]
MSEVAPGSSPRKLPLRQILLGAFVLPWRNRVAVMRATSLPLLFLVAAQLWWHASSYGESEAVVWVAWATFVLFVAWIAITVHRLVLANGWMPRSAFAELGFRRFAFFVGALVFLWALYQAVTLVVMGLLLNVVYPPRFVPAGEVAPADPMDAMHLAVLGFIAAILAYWLIGRISLILPAIAIDLKPSVASAWRSARGNAWKIAIVVGALPWVLEQLTFALWRENATAIEIASLGGLTGVCVIIQVVALSLCYFELTRASAPPPTHPPG